MAGKALISQDRSDIAVVFDIRGPKAVSEKIDAQQATAPPRPKPKDAKLVHEIDCCRQPFARG
jgi:hypothetical protein